MSTGRSAGDELPIMTTVHVSMPVETKPLGCGGGQIKYIKDRTASFGDPFTGKCL